MPNKEKMSRVSALLNYGRKNMLRTLTARVPDEHLKILGDFCSNNHIRMSDLIRAIVEDFIDETIVKQKSS